MLLCPVLRSPLQPVLRLPTDAAGGGGDPDVADYLTRLAAAGGSSNAGSLAAYRVFVASAKASGYWTKLLRLNLFMGPNLTSALVPQKVGGGNATDTNVNFVGGDYTEATGLTGNGSTKYLNTGIVFSTMLTANSTHTALYNRSAAASLPAGASTDANNSNRVFAPSGATYISEQYDNASGRLSVATGATPYGFIIATRTAANSHVIYRNGSSVGSNATAGGTPSALSCFVFAINSAGSPASHGAGPAGAYSFGAGLSAAEVLAYATHMETFQDALSRGVA